MNTTRYAIELKPGKYAYGNAIVDFDNAKLYSELLVGNVLFTWLDQFPNARIVPVKCEQFDPSPVTVAELLEMGFIQPFVESPDHFEHPQIDRPFYMISEGRIYMEQMGITITGIGQLRRLLSGLGVQS